MALRNILTREDPALYKISRPVDKFDRRLHQLLDDMRETLHEANGAGLAAPQIGVLRRVAIVQVEEDGEVYEFVNPVIIHTEGEQEGEEGCLSVPGLYGIVKRPMIVTVRAQDRHGKTYEATGEGLTARAFAHELDHLDGHIFTELVSRYLDPEDMLEERRKESDEAST